MDSPFRTSRGIDDLLSSKNYNVFFVCSHGELVSNDETGQFDPDPKSILVFTGAGDPGSVIATNKQIEKELMNLFDPINIKRTFAAFLGMYNAHSDLLYKVHGDVPASPELLLSIDPSDKATDIGFWGVFKHTGSVGTRREYSNIEEIPSLSEQLYDGIFASTLVQEIHDMYKRQNKVNIILFISCRVASKRKRVRNYTDAAAAALTHTHFMEKYEPTSLDAHVPKEDVKPDRIYLSNPVYPSLVPLDTKDRIQPVSDVLLYIRKRFGMFDHDGVKSLYVIDKAGNPIRLKPDVPLDSQWHSEDLVDKDKLRIHPMFTEESKPPASENGYHTTNLLENSVARKRRTQKGGRRRKKYSRRAPYNRHTQ